MTEEPVVRYRLTYLLLSLLVFASCIGIEAQEITRKSFYFEKNLTYESFASESPGKEIFSSLSSNNITSLYFVSIDVASDLLIQLNRAEVGQLSANITIQNYSLEGETHFRNFPIDTLLMPDLIEGNMHLFYNDQLILSQPWLLSVRAGHVRMFVPDSIRLQEKGLRVELELKTFNYSEERLNIYNQTANLINTYYAYTSVLKNMVRYYTKNELNRNQKPSHLFVAWEEIQRVNNYIYKYQFYNRLELEGYDPAGFLPVYNKSIRLQRRATTLKGWVSRSSVKGIVEDKEAFCSAFTGLSQKYLDLAGSYQPYIASGYFEVARMINNELVKDMLQDASGFYDVFNRKGIKSTKQIIYEHFIELAKQAMNRNKFVSALEMLYNANLMTDWFNEIQASPDYDKIYLTTIDGLMSSYLMVATMAYRSETYHMAEAYYQKAMDVYELHRNNLQGRQLASDAFLAFIEQQTKRSYNLIDKEDYFSAISLLNKAKAIGEQQKLNYDQSKIDSAFTLSYTGIYSKKLDSIQQMLNERQTDQALEAINQTDDFSKEQSRYLRDVNKLHFNILAKALFDAYYKQGEQLLSGQNADQALFAFLKAQKINEKYLGEEHHELDSLIYNATVPVIVNLTEQAAFEVWANRMQNANALLAEAKKMQSKYQLENDQEVTAVIMGLEKKIANRHCTNLGNRCFEIEKKAENRIGAGKYHEAEKLLLEARRIIKEYPECNISTGRISALFRSNEAVFNYLKLQKKTDSIVAHYDYNGALVMISQMHNYYYAEDIERFGLNPPNVFDYVQTQSNPEFTYAVAEFFTNKNQYSKAFDYLDLLKEQQVRSKETRDLQQKIGEGLASTDRVTSYTDKDIWQAVNGSDKWYRQLKKAFYN